MLEGSNIGDEVVVRLGERSEKREGGRETEREREERGDASVRGRKSRDAFKAGFTQRLYSRVKTLKRESPLVSALIVHASRTVKGKEEERERKERDLTQNSSNPFAFCNPSIFSILLFPTSTTLRLVFPSNPSRLSRPLWEM